MKQYRTQWYGIRNTLTPVFRIPTGRKDACLKKFAKKSQEGQQLPKTDALVQALYFFFI